MGLMAFDDLVLYLKGTGSDRSLSGIGRNSYIRVNEGGRGVSESKFGKDFVRAMEGEKGKAIRCEITNNSGVNGDIVVKTRR